MAHKPGRNGARKVGRGKTHGNRSGSHKNSIAKATSTGRGFTKRVAHRAGR